MYFNMNNVLCLMLVKDACRLTTLVWLLFVCVCEFRMVSLFSYVSGGTALYSISTI